MTRRSFCTLSAVALASLSLHTRAFADELGVDVAETDAPAPGPIVIVHTNDVHCAVDENLGYAKLADYANTARRSYGNANVTLVDAGDAVQGKAMGTLSNGEYLVEIMNECKYDFAIPGNHEYDFGMTQFNTLVARADATYLSCNFTDLRTGNLMLSPYEVRDYETSAGTKRIAFVGICTPETLTKPSPVSFQDESGNYIFGFCEGGNGAALYAAVQNAVDQARDAGQADYVVAIAHLGRHGVTECWSSSSVAANTTGIDVIIDGHSHEEYTDSIPNRDGEPVLVTQTGTQLVSIGQVVIDPVANTISATTPNCSGTLVKAWGGSDAAVAAFVAGKRAELEKITGQVIGHSDVRLIALEDDNYTWAVRHRETNLGDFISDAYLALAWHGGIMADIGFANGGGMRSSIEHGDVTYGNLIDAQPYNNQLCYVDTLGQNILDALEAGVRDLPNPSGGFQHVSGMSFTVRTDIPSSVQMQEGKFVGVTGEYRVRDVMVGTEPLDVNKRYKLVSHAYLIVQGGDGLNMFMKDEAVLLDLDNKALIDYIRYDLKGTIGSEYADPNGQGRIVIKDGPDPEPTPLPTPEPIGGSGGKPLASTGDPAGTAAAATLVAAVVAGATGAACLGANRRQ